MTKKQLIELWNSLDGAVQQGRRGDVQVLGRARRHGRGGRPRGRRGGPDRLRHLGPDRQERREHPPRRGRQGRPDSSHDRLSLPLRRL